MVLKIKMIKLFKLTSQFRLKIHFSNHNNNYKNLIVMI